LSIYFFTFWHFSGHKLNVGCKKRYTQQLKIYIPIKIEFAWNLAQKIGSRSSLKNRRLSKDKLDFLSADHGLIFKAKNKQNQS